MYSDSENKKEQLLKFAHELKNNGFTVYIPFSKHDKEPAFKGLDTYFYFVKDNKIGYVENSGWGFNFSTIHKPNRKCGTGFSIHREVFKPTVEMANDCLIFAPNWAYPSDCKEIVKYKNWNEYATINNWQNYKEL